VNQNLLNDICLQQLTLSGVHEGETISVLTQGEERADYADAFMWGGAEARREDLPPAAALAGQRVRGVGGRPVRPGR